MTEQDQQIAIAEFCGTNTWPKGRYGPVFENNRLTHVSTSPDYLHDLNAMHEAELSLGSLIGAYRSYLVVVCDRTNQWPAEATASQRAEALLRTIGKWKD